MRGEIRISASLSRQPLLRKQGVCRRGKKKRKFVFLRRKKRNLTFGNTRVMSQTEAAWIEVLYMKQTRILSFMLPVMICFAKATFHFSSVYILISEKNQEVSSLISPNEC